MATVITYNDITSERTTAITYNDITSERTIEMAKYFMRTVQLACSCDICRAVSLVEPTVEMLNVLEEAVDEEEIPKYNVLVFNICCPKCNKKQLTFLVVTHEMFVCPIKNSPNGGYLAFLSVYTDVIPTTRELIRKFMPYKKITQDLAKKFFSRLVSNIVADNMYSHLSDISKKRVQEITESKFGLKKHFNDEGKRFDSEMKTYNDDTMWKAYIPLTVVADLLDNDKLVTPVLDYFNIPYVTPTLDILNEV